LLFFATSFLHLGMATIEQHHGGFRVPYYEIVTIDGKPKKKRRYRSFKTAIEAETFNLEQELLNDKSPLHLTAEERLVISRWKVLAANAGKQLYDLAPGIEQFIKDQTNPSPVLPLGVSEFLEDLERRNKSQHTIDQYTLYLEEFSTLHSLKRVCDVSRADVVSFILNRYHNDNSRGFVRTPLGAFFQWAQKKGWAQGWDKKIQWDKNRIPEKRVSTFTPEQFKEILNHAPESIRLGLALQGFLGIRPEEMSSSTGKPVLRWKDVNFEERVIHINGDVSKVGTFRDLYDIPQSVWAWLEATPKSKRKGPLITCNHRNFKATRARALKKGTNLEHWPKDVLRHSAASYGWKHPDIGIETVMEWLGHRNPKIFFKHYKTAASKKTALEWYSIAP